MKKLTKGYVFKNIKFVGEWLGKEVPTKVQTKTKISWLKELDRYCTWHKEGNKIVIDEVFEVVKEKVDGRVENMKRVRVSQESYYKKPLQQIVLDYLTDNFDYEGSMQTLLYKEDIVTRKFNEEHNNKVVKAYHETVNNKLRKAFISALNELQALEVIKYSREMLFMFKGETEEWLLPDEYKSLYKEAYAYAEEATGMKPFTEYQYMLGCQSIFKAEVVKYMNAHGNFEKEIASYKKPFVIEKGEKFVECKMSPQDKKKFMQTIHERVSISKTVIDSKATIEKYGKEKEDTFIKTLEDIKRAFFYIDEIEKAEKIKQGFERYIVKIEKQIKLNIQFSDVFTAIREVTRLNEEYKELMGKNNDMALEFLMQYN